MSDFRSLWFTDEGRTSPSIVGKRVPVEFFRLSGFGVIILKTTVWTTGETSH